jgi:AraC-like DNA-binding protein
VPNRPNPNPWTPLGMPDLVLMVSPAQAYRDNIHSEFKLVWCAGGYQVERRGRRYHAGADQLIVLHPGEAHSGQPDQKDESERGQWRIICVPPSLVAQVADPNDLRFEPPVLDASDLAQQFRSVFALFEEPASRAEREEGLRELISTLVPFGTPADPPVPVDPADEAALQRAKRYLTDRLARNVTLDELAEVAKVDKFRLVRACTAQLGVAPHTLHLRMRLDRARQLIRLGRQLRAVGQETGFYDQAHFTRTFTRAFGMTPKQYQASWTGTGPDRKLAP